jgi:drug/metabolite transporter (DMT)-like permease
MGFFLIILACTCWAFDTYWRFPLLQSGLDAVVIVFFEHAILTALSLILLFRRLLKVRNLTVETLFYLFVVGGLGSAIATVSFTKAFEFLNPSIVIIFQKLQPFVVILLARIVLKEPIQRAFIFWLIIAILGSLILSYQDIIRFFSSPDFSLGYFFRENSVRGYGLTLVAVFGWGAATVFGKKLTQKDFSEVEIMSGRYLMGFLVLLPIVFDKRPFSVINGQDLVTISMMVGLSAIIGMYLYYRGLKRTSARNAAIAELFFPFGAACLNWVVLGMELQVVHVLGALLLIFAAFMIQFKRY